MSFWQTIATAKDLLCAIAQDILSMGGFWVVDGQTKTGQLIEELAERDIPDSDE